MIGFTTHMVLVQSSAVKNTAIVAGNEALRHMSAVRESKLTPSVDTIIGRIANYVVGHQGQGEGIKTAIVVDS
jgi:hypothetical protein